MGSNSGCLRKRHFPLRCACESFHNIPLVASAVKRWRHFRARECDILAGISIEITKYHGYAALAEGARPDLETEGSVTGIVAIWCPPVRFTELFRIKYE